MFTYKQCKKSYFDTYFNLWGNDLARAAPGGKEVNDDKLILVFAQFFRKFFLKGKTRSLVFAG